MEWSIRRWRPGHLLASWAAYWAGLAAVSLGPISWTAWRVTRLPEGKVEISVGFSNSTLHFTVIEEGVRTVTATTSLGIAIAWVLRVVIDTILIFIAVRRLLPSSSHGVAVDGESVNHVPIGGVPTEQLESQPEIRVADVALPPHHIPLPHELGDVARERAEPARRSQQHVGEPRMHRQRGHPASVCRDAERVVDRLELDEQLTRLRVCSRRRRVQPRELRRIRHAGLGEHQHERREVGLEDLRR